MFSQGFLTRKHQALAFANTMFKYDVYIYIIENICENGTKADLRSILPKTIYEDKMTILPFAFIMAEIWLF